MIQISSLSRKIKTLISNPKEIGVKFLYLISPILSDRIYIQLMFYLKVGSRLNLDHPQTFNEKLQWLKLNYRYSSLSRLVDKYEVKQYVEDTIGRQYVVRNYGVWNSFEEIDFNDLPSEFVLKTTHDQGGVVICKDKYNFNLDNAKRKINKHLKRKFYYRLREWPYKNVKPRILAEELLHGGESAEINDYKFFCFNGEPKVMFVSTERETGKPKYNFYDINFQPLNIVRGYGMSEKDIEKPLNYDLMVDLATKLSKGLPHVRVDFYDIGNRILFGELTFFSGGGFRSFKPEKWDHIFGDWLDLNKDRYS